MCGRYTQTRSGRRLAERFAADAVWWDGPPRYNLAPSQPAPVVLVEQGRRVLRPLQWGLVPSWADDPAIGYRLINARAESLPEKPAFRAAVRRRRCLVPADGFYEWRKDPNGRTPMHARLADGAPFAFAGLWERWTSTDGSELDTFTIVTTEPNTLLAPIHNRMPAILRPEDEPRWLDPAADDPVELTGLLQPYSAEAMAVHPVSRRVNRPANDGPELIEPAEPAETQHQGRLF